MPAELRERYFEGADQRLSFRNDLRRTVIFGRNNLVQDAPISRLDLLVCRNTLMYFNAETQARILRHFHFALVDTGALMLGKSEMMITHRELFAPAELKHRIFVKRHAHRRRRASPAAQRRRSRRSPTARMSGPRATQRSSWRTGRTRSSRGAGG